MLEHPWLQRAVPRADAGAAAARAAAGSAAAGAAIGDAADVAGASVDTIGDSATDSLALSLGGIDIGAVVLRGLELLVGAHASYAAEEFQWKVLLISC